ncbi:MAG: hypothetical protein QXH42_01825 [Thermoplasmata archaeon]
MGQVDRERSGGKGCRRIARDRRGSEGFFEELPAFLVVVVGLAIFFVSIYRIGSSLGEEGELKRLEGDCERLYKAFRSWTPVLERGPISREPLTAHIDTVRLGALNDTSLRSGLHPAHNFNITVTDLRTGQVWGFGKPVPANTGVRVSGPVVVVESSGEHNPGELTVVMWK